MLPLLPEPQSTQAQEPFLENAGAQRGSHERRKVLGKGTSGEGEQRSYQRTKSGINHPHVQFRFHFTCTTAECLWTLAEHWCNTTTEKNGTEASHRLKRPHLPYHPCTALPAQNCALAGMNAASSRPRPVPPRPPDEACAAAAPQKARAELVT